MAAVSAPAKSNTVYVRNLEEKVKIPDLIEALESIFSSFGTILEIVAKKNLRAKGQAFVVFEDADSAESAIQEIQGFDLFDRPMTLDYARTKSDATIKRQGDEEEFEAHKRRRLAEKERKQALELAEAQKRAKRPAQAEAQSARPGKAAKGTGLKSTHATGAIVADEYLPPNKILFLQNLPEEYDVDGLTTIFGRFEGFREVRLVPGRKGIAFVEYENESGAIGAKESTTGMTLGEDSKAMKVTFQRQ